VTDPTFFVSFAFVEKDPVALADAPRGCAVSLRRPTRIIDQAEATRLGESLLETLRQSVTPFADQFANRAIVACG
jgi:hypothetical protein